MRELMEGDVSSLHPLHPIRFLPAPPSHFLEEDTMVTTKEKQGSGTREEKFEEFPTCYIDEEISEELDSQEAALASEHTSDKGMESGKNKGAGMKQQREDAPNTDEENRSGGMTREGGKVLSPPPISSMREQWCVPPLFFHPEHLELLFDLWGQMTDQIHCGILVSQRLDMQYDAFSNESARKRCPTWAYPFVIQSKEGVQDDEADMATD